MKADCKDVSLNNNKQNNSCSVERILQTDDNFTPFPSFIGAVHACVQQLQNEEIFARNIIMMK